MSLNKLGLCSLVVLSASVGFSQQSFENKMHTIYKSSYQTEITDEFWDQYKSSVNTRSYQVAGGDTLWKLSQVFFGDGFYWSKIWSYNKKLTNPHLLFVGQNIRFFTGSLEMPPSVDVGGQSNEGHGDTSVSVVTNNEQPVESSLYDGTGANTVIQKTVGAGDHLKEGASNAGLYPGAPSIPPPQKSLTPVQPIPGSFAESLGYNVQQYDEKGLSLDLRPPIKVNPRFVAQSFVYDKNLKEYPRVGSIIESEDGNLLLGLNEKVYVHSKEAMNIGDDLTVMGPQYDFDRNGVSGHVIRYLAVIRITESIGENKYRAAVVKSMAGIRPNSWLTKEKVPSFEDDFSGRPSSVKMPIIGGGFDNYSRLYGQSDFVFLLTKDTDNVRVGDILGIYKRRISRVAQAQIEKSPLPIGHLKIIRKEGKLLTAFIVESSEEIKPGDESGRPTRVVDVASQSEKDDLGDIEDDLDFSEEESEIQ